MRWNVQSTLTTSRQNSSCVGMMGVFTIFCYLSSFPLFPPFSNSAIFLSISWILYRVVAQLFFASVSLILGVTFSKYRQLSDMGLHNTPNSILYHSHLISRSLFPSVRLRRAYWSRTEIISIFGRTSISSAKFMMHAYACLLNKLVRTFLCRSQLYYTRGPVQVLIPKSLFLSFMALPDMGACHSAVRHHSRHW